MEQSSESTSSIERGRSSRKSSTKKKVVSQPTPSHVRNISDALVLKSGGLFLVTARDGSIPLTSEHGFGLYYRDCRYLNGYTLQLGASRPHALVANASEGFKCVLQLSNEEFEGFAGSRIAKEQLGIRWKRVLDSLQNRLVDSIVFQNFSLEKMHFSTRLSFASAFEDIFEVRGLLEQERGRIRPAVWEGNTLTFGYEGRDQVYRTSTMSFFPTPSGRKKQSADFEVKLESQSSLELVLCVSIRETDALFGPIAIDEEPKFEMIENKVRKSREKWLEKESKIESDSLSLNRTLKRSLSDLKMLETSYEGNNFFAAGIPWFSTIFGRDSLITAMQTLAFDPSLAEQTLCLLARFQGKTNNAWTEESPGKILHELRVGELARLGVIPHTPYYGSIDSTPLFLVLLSRHAQWTGSLKVFNKLRPNVEKALDWLLVNASIHGGYLRYEGRPGSALTSQGWKDSWEGVMNTDGSIVQAPVALVEVQSYWYSCLLGIAALYRQAGEEKHALFLEEEANDLKTRFEEDFWNEKSGYALALQAGNVPARVISSNQGHALWSKIASHPRAKWVSERLMKPDMFSGWGIRTLSEKERRYNPLGYHVGTVWPHDNSLIAAGFKNYGFDTAVLQLFDGIFRSSIFFPNQRLPELFAGFSEEEYGVPVHYPVACHPQAWAAGTIPYFLEILLGLNPEGFSKRLRITHPLLPDFVDRLEFRNLQVGEATADLGFSRTTHGGISVEVLRTTGEIEIVVEPSASK